MKLLKLRATGSLACFTRPEFKAERVSYAVITPSAARGILEAVLWKPAIRWRVERILVLSEIKWTAFRRNEVGSRAPTPSERLIAGGGVAPMLLVENDRAQRNTVALADVDYVIEARFEMTARAGPDDNPAKFIDMFERRLDRGQHFQQPYFGCREFIADVEPSADDAEPINDTRDLGMMLYDLDYGQERTRPIFFPARLEHGVLDVPAEFRAPNGSGS